MIVKFTTGFQFKRWDIIYLLKNNRISQYLVFDLIGGVNIDVSTIENGIKEYILFYGFITVSGKQFIFTDYDAVFKTKNECDEYRKTHKNTKFKDYVNHYLHKHDKIITTNEKTYVEFH